MLKLRCRWGQNEGNANKKLAHDLQILPHAYKQILSRQR